VVFNLTIFLGAYIIFLMDKLRKLQLFNIIFLSIAVLLCIILTIANKFSFLLLTASVSSIAYMVFLSNKNIFNFLVGLISTTTYIFIAYQTKLYGETIFYLFFDLPMIFISYALWLKNRETRFTVYSRKLNNKNIVLISLISIIVLIVYGFILKAIGGALPFIDAFSTVVSLLATILMALRFREQWICWVLVYLNGVIMWAAAGNLLMLIAAICSLVSCIIGFIN